MLFIILVPIVLNSLSIMLIAYLTIRYSCPSCSSISFALPASLASSLKLLHSSTYNRQHSSIVTKTATSSPSASAEHNHTYNLQIT